MKKIIAILLAGMMTATAFAGCGGGESSGSGSEGSGSGSGSGSASGESKIQGVDSNIVDYKYFGEEDNIKLTTPRDMLFAAAILKDRGEYLADRAWV